MAKNKLFITVALIVVGCCGLIGMLRAPRLGININGALYKANIVDVLIVGSGPAGYSAALYAARFNYHVVLLKGPNPGGLLTETSDVENWPGQKKVLGSQLINGMEEQVRALGVQIIQDSVETVDFSGWPLVVKTEQGLTINALSVIIATGGVPFMLGVDGEKEYWAKGVTACAKCDAPNFRDEEVVVVGGGDSAIEEAIQLVPYAKKITILVRKDRMKAATRMQDRLLQYPSISVRFNVEVKEVLGDENQLTGIVLWNNKERTLTEMPINGVFLAIGHQPNTQVFASALKVDEQGYITLTDGRSQKTSVPGVFAAGDVEDNYYRQAVVASGSGVRAAIDADAFLTEIGLTPQMKSRLRPHLLTAKEEDVPATFVTSIKEFDTLIAAGNLVVVDFFKDDCPQCNEFEPIFKGVAKQYVGRAEFIKVNAQELIDLADRLYLYKVPCLLIFKDGDIVARYNGIMSKDELKVAVDKFM